MITGKSLYKLNTHCTNLGGMCHKNINRILDSIKEHPHCAGELAKFTKCCIILEKLCECICTCCCNADCVGTGLMSEFKGRCKIITHCCNDLKNKLPKEKCKYLRCDTFLNMCKNKQATRKRSSKKNRSRRKYK